jgi:hypothetical protein
MEAEARIPGLDAAAKMETETCFHAGLGQGLGCRIRKVKLFAVAAWICLCVTVLRAADPTPDSSPCGPFPKLYKEIVWTWMQKNLVDPESAKIEWQGEPKCSDIGKNGQHEYGWQINFTVNSRNRWGVYTGKQQHGVLIRNGEVVKGIGFGY